MTRNLSIIAMLFSLAFSACDSSNKNKEEEVTTNKLTPMFDMQSKVEEYTSFKLEADLSSYDDNQKLLIAKLIEIAEVMDGLFWKQAYGNKDSLLNKIEDANTRKFANINYGPWDRLNDNKPFINGIGPKPLGAQYYPLDMTKEEFEKFESEDKTSLYTIITRDESGALKSVPYHEYYFEELSKASALLKEAAQLTNNEAFKKYLTLRSDALMSSNYYESDMAWMEMKDNDIDVVVGPIENYEDQLFNYKATFEAYVLLKDKEWSDKLSKYISYLPQLQAGLPVPAEYKKEEPGTDSDLNAYDVVYYAGDCNAGSKTIAINLPNDERVQLEKGTRRLQLKNAMKAKFDKILLPIADVLIDSTQRKHITFDAFFANTMFHEVAHGLGIKNTIDGNNTVRKALQEKGSAIEEGKADILGLYMVTQLHGLGELGEDDLMDYYTTFLAGIFRSVRFGGTSAHGKANMIRFNFFKEMDAFSYNTETHSYSVNFEKFQAAMNTLSAKILVLQGDGDYEGVNTLFDVYGNVGADLQADLDRVNDAGIPKDIIFEQGKGVLGL